MWNVLWVTATPPPPPPKKNKNHEFLCPFIMIVNVDFVTNNPLLFSHLPLVLGNTSTPSDLPLPPKKKKNKTKMHTFNFSVLSFILYNLTTCFTNC